MNRPQRRVEFDTLNLLGKAVYVGGSAVRLLAKAIDGAVDRAVDVVLDVEKAFKQGLDPNIEDAKILQETSGSREKSGNGSRDAASGTGAGPA